MFEDVDLKIGESIEPLRAWHPAKKTQFTHCSCHCSAACTINTCQNCTHTCKSCACTKTCMCTIGCTGNAC